MSKKLAYNVHVMGEDGNMAVYGPDSQDIPESVAKQITNPSAWEVDEDEVTGSDAGLPPDVVAERRKARGEDPDDGPAPAEEDGGGKPYKELLVDDLKAEVDRRNEGREDADRIQVGGKGNKGDLVKALEADDKARADNA